MNIRPPHITSASLEAPELGAATIYQERTELVRALMAIDTQLSPEGTIAATLTHRLAVLSPNR